MWRRRSSRSKPLPRPSPRTNRESKCPSVTALPSTPPLSPLPVLYPSRSGLPYLALDHPPSERLSAHCDPLGAVEILLCQRGPEVQVMGPHQAKRLLLKLRGKLPVGRSASKPVHQSPIPFLLVPPQNPADLTNRHPQLLGRLALTQLALVELAHHSQSISFLSAHATIHSLLSSTRLLWKRTFLLCTNRTLPLCCDSTGSPALPDTMLEPGGIGRARVATHLRRPPS